MACPCCGPVWVCNDCCCPDGSEAPSTITLTLSNHRAPERDEVGALRWGGRFYAPANYYLFSDISLNGSYTLKQDTFGPYTAASAPSANNCIFYSYRDGKKELQAGRWPREAGTLYYFSFSGLSIVDGQPLSLAGAFNGGTLYDICSGQPGRQDISANCDIIKNGVRWEVFGDGRVWPLTTSFDVFISR
jgi:hypothetical protein